MKHYTVIHLDDSVPVAKLCRALATHGLVLSNQPDGRLVLHESPSLPPARGEIKSDPPAVVVRVPNVFRIEWWRR